MSGNPHGRPKTPAPVQELIRENTEKAIKTVIALLDSESDKVALMAAQEILNRSLGKPLQTQNIQMDMSGEMALRAEVRAALLESMDA